MTAEDGSDPSQAKGAVQLKRPSERKPTRLPSAVVDAALQISTTTAINPTADRGGNVKSAEDNRPRSYPTV